MTRKLFECELMPYLCGPIVEVAAVAGIEDLVVTGGRRTSLSAADVRSAMPRLRHQEGKARGFSESSYDGVAATASLPVNIMPVI